MWFLYVVRCSDSSLYIGIATDVARRFKEHSSQGKKCAKYLRGNDPLKLVFTIEAGTRSEAARLEARLKKRTKADKEQLVKGERSLVSLDVV